MKAEHLPMEAQPVTRPGQVCDRCHGMLSSVEGQSALSIWYESGFHHYTQSEMQQSVAKGCPMCKIISTAANPYDPPTCYSFHAKYRTGSRDLDVDVGEPFRITTIDGLHLGKREGRYIRLSVFTGAGNTAHTMPTNHRC